MRNLKRSLNKLYWINNTLTYTRDEFIKAITNTIPPLMIVTIRYALAVIVFIFLLYLKERNFQFSIIKKHWKLLLIMPFLSVAIYGADNTIVINRGK